MEPDDDAVDYWVDFGLVLDLEDIRQLIDGCLDLGVLEAVRNRLEAAVDLEQFRSGLEDVGVVEFRDCPAGVVGFGIRQQP